MMTQIIYQQFLKIDGTVNIDVTTGGTFPFMPFITKIDEAYSSLTKYNPLKKELK